MKKIYFILIFNIFAIIPMLSQTCYHVIANMNGVDISGYQSELNDVACQVRDTIPVSFQNQFGIFDFGFYQILGKTSSGFDDAWQNAIEQALQSKRYNIVFGRESSAEEGIDVNFRVKVNLPDENEFSCLTDEKIVGLEKEMTLILNEKGILYHKKEIEAMRVFNSFVQRMKDCCAGNRSQLNFIDTTKLKIQVYIDDCGSTPVPKNSVALIVNNTMPNIGLRVSYPQGLTGQFCTEVFVSVSIQYIKTLPDNPERSRDDLVVFKMYNVSLNDFNEINWENKIRGGRVKVIVKQYEQSQEVLKSFDFTIKGRNPKIGEVINHVNSLYGHVWFMKKLIIKESGTPSIDVSTRMEHFEPFDPNTEHLHLTWDGGIKKRSMSRCPKSSYNGDGGYGLMQITNPPPISRQLWDWERNIAAGYDILISKKTGIKNRIIPELDAVDEWNEIATNPKVEKISIIYGGINWKMGTSNVFGDDYAKINNYFNETLEKGERSFLDACMLLAYNGYKGTDINDDDNYKNFLKLIIPDNGDRPYWTTMDNRNDYVKNISLQAEPLP